MPGSKRFLHPEAIKRISRLEIRARHVVEGFLSGMHRSPYFGQSVEFLQHREYVTGDDLRHVDWKVWARQDRLYVKQFEEETNLRCNLLVDVSKSMAYGNGPLNKYEYACTLACSLAYLVLRQQDAVGCVAFDEKIRTTVPMRTKNNHIFSIVDSLAVQEPRDKTDMYAVLRTVAETAPRRGVVVLVSDLLGRPAGAVQGPAAPAAARARRAGVPRDGRRRAGFPVQRPDAVRRAGNARLFELQPAGPARRLHGRAAGVPRRSPAPAAPQQPATTP